MQLTDVEDHYSDNREIDEDRSRALESTSANEGRFGVLHGEDDGVTYTLVKSTSGTDEETSTDGTTDGDHVQMACLHGLVKNDHGAAVRTTLERGEVQTIARHEALLLTPFGRLTTDRHGGSVDGRLLVMGDGLLVVHGGRQRRRRSATAWGKGRRG
jgi:hypothetical protein